MSLINAIKNSTNHIDIDAGQNMISRSTLRTSLRVLVAAFSLVLGGHAYAALPTHVPTVSTFNTYDVMGRLVTVMDGKGFQTTFTYDGEGNRLTQKDAFGRVTSYSYDALNRLTTMTDPASGVTKFGYDSLDHVVSVTDPRSLVTSYTYDGLDNLLKLVSPDTNTTTYTQDAAGNLKTKTDARSKTGTWSYDALNRVTSIAWDDQTWGFTWDTAANGIGRLGSFSDLDGSTRYAYDAQGHTTSVSRTTTANLIQTVGYGWGAGSRLTNITYPSGMAVGYTWQDGVITSVSVNGQALISNIKWQAWGAPLSWTWANGQTWSRTGDANGRTAGLATGDANKVYTYDNVGNITAITDSTRATLNQGFRYDSMDRLTNASVASGTAWNYTYDANGNRITSGDTATPYTYGATSNHLTGIQSSPAVSFQYDTAGNQTARAGTTFAFDNAGRMIKSAESGTAIGSYIYNAMGQRVQKTAAGATTRFMYDEAGHLLGEYGSTGIAAQETVYLADWPIATVRKNGAGTAIAYYVWPDHLGTPRQVTDATSQKVIWRWEGGPFGTNAPNQDPQSTGTQFVYNLRFPGQYWDNEISRMSNGFRDYDPNLGRYIESDPIGLKGGISTYAYVNGNPVRSIDPAGLATEVCTRPLQIPFVPYAQHCFIRYNGDNNDTSSYDPRGVHPDPNPGAGVCTASKGPENDECVRIEMAKCQGSDYSFLGNNCCNCAENALKACGQSIPMKKWPNWPINPGPQPGERGYTPRANTSGGQ